MQKTPFRLLWNIDCKDALPFIAPKQREEIKLHVAAQFFRLGHILLSNIEPFSSVAIVAIMLSERKEGCRCVVSMKIL